MDAHSTVSTPNRLELIALRHLGLIEPGDDLPALIVAALDKESLQLRDGDVVVIAQKIVSKAEGRHARLADVVPSGRAAELARRCDKDPRLVELMLREANEVLRCVPGVIIVENRHGVVLANAGIDRSNVDQDEGGERVLLLPADPDRSSAAFRARFKELAAVDVGVVINDSIGRAWRNGTQGTAIGISGVPALSDLRGQPDLFGFRLRVTEVGTADEIAAAASLLMGQSGEGRPVVLLRGLPHPRDDGRARDLIRPHARDLFR
jgi:coenzyme F420-0:L-glutamate ligase/coenzyme F420-1:gamma-L-glutamate ligase